MVENQWSKDGRYELYETCVGTELAVSLYFSAKISVPGYT